MRVTLVALLLLAGCPGKYKAPKDPAGTGNGNGVGPVKGVEDAALPYAIVDGHTGKAVTEAELWTSLASARAVCVGEEHPNPHHHWAELTIVGTAAEKLAGKRLALGMEMVESPFQGVLDDWSAQRIDEAALLSRVGWEDRWGYPFALYRPILERARKGGMPIIALNASRDLVKAVARKGVDGLSPDEKAKLPPLVLDDAQHRAWFDKIMTAMEEGHGHGGADGPKDLNPDNIYAAQVVRDESMAENTRHWLGQGGDTMVIIAGNGHCHDSAIIRRLVRRGGGPAVSIRPIIDDGEGNVADALAEAQNDYLFVMTMPRQ
jgi:uncharacterized iron-regulated protein